MKWPDDFINKVICGDCLEILPQIPDGVIDAVITDPPYPKLDYGWEGVDFSKFTMPCRQFWFWMNNEPFPVEYTAKHIWSKSNIYIGKCEQYETIYEVNGTKVGSVMRYGAINSQIAAQMNRDKYINHPCQKPIKLMRRIIEMTDADLILDPFAGSGTTLVAAKQLGRRYIGIEISPEYCKIAEDRLRQGELF